MAGVHIKSYSQWIKSLDEVIHWVYTRLDMTNYILVNKTSWDAAADSVSPALINLDHVKSVEAARRGIKALAGCPRAIINFAVGLENPSEESPADFIAVTDSLDDIIIKINQAKS